MAGSYSRSPPCGRFLIFLAGIDVIGNPVSLFIRVMPEAAAGLVAQQVLNGLETLGFSEIIMIDADGNELQPSGATLEQVEK